MVKRLIFITGGARSGKSRLAERIASQLGGQVLYVATAEAGDAEMVERIRRHRERRPHDWRTLEVGWEVAPALRRAQREADVVLLDCVSLWVSNLLLARLPADGEVSPAVAGVAVTAVTDAVEELLRGYRDGTATYIMVSNEVGSGVVPVTPLGRLYRDVLGVANQTLAAAADHVYCCVAGRVLDLSTAPTVDGFELRLLLI